jgi:DNA replication protein
MIDEEDIEENNIYSKFEEEFGRTLSPIEYELINGWQETGYNKEVILEALKEAVLNGVTNLKYIDRILIEWDKKGIKSSSQVHKDKENYSKKKDISIPDFDWVNDEDNS